MNAKGRGAMLKALSQHWPEYLVEAAGLGAFMISACLFVAALEHPASWLRHAVEDPVLRRLVIGVAMGLTAIAIIYSPWGKRSGAHLNPAVTLTFFRLGKVEPWDALFYVLAQFAGGVAGVLLAGLSLGQPVLADASVNYVATLPGKHGIGAAFIAELVISFGLMWVVLTTTNSRRLNRFTGLFAGLLVATYIALEAPLSGMSMNPARTFGSALPAHAWTGLWIYFTAPPLGMLLAAELYLRTKGATSILCCKLHHENNERCIFRCRYPHAIGQTVEIAPAGPSQGIHRRDRFGRIMGWTSDAIRFAERSVAPFVDLVIRLGLAQIFLVSAILKLSNWENAITLATYEYPVSWMDPATAAYVGIAIELSGGALLAVGLATRFAAAAMLALSLVIQFNYVVVDANLFWAVLFGWYAVRGAGPLSLDHAVSRGLGDSALPFAAAGIRLTTGITRTLGPIYQLFLRLWIAAALAIAGWQLALETHRAGADLLGQLQLWLPSKSAAVYPAYAAVIAAPLLAIGLATRAAALALILYTLAVPMTDPAFTGDWYWLAVFGLLALYGPGELSVDAFIERGLRRLFPQLQGKPAFSLDGLPQVVIVGAGFGGLACAAALRRTRVSVTLVDRHNYHLFQPLLYQVATTALSPGDIATPVRGLFREYFNVRVLLGEVTGIDTAAQHVVLADQRLPYDYLVLATGASHSYFGRDEWEPYAPGLKRIEDATDVRRRLLMAFERAEAIEDVEERRALLTFLVVGGGPTGVELAGAIAELAKYGMEKEFRRFDPATARVILVQSGPRVLPTFPEHLSERAKRSLEKLGVHVLVDNRVEDIDEAGVLVSGRRIAARTVFWAAGVVASPAARWLRAEADKAGRLKVNPDLTVPGLAKVFAIGDTASVEGWQGQPVPGLAPAAKQGGIYVARVIRARIEGRAPPSRFAYKHLGSLATIGRKAAVADFGWLRLSGAPAWWLWGAVHVAFLVGLRNRISVLFDWFWAYLTFRSGTRLITGSEPRNREPIEAPLSAPRLSAIGNTVRS